MGDDFLWQGLRQYHFGSHFQVAFRIRMFSFKLRAAPSNLTQAIDVLPSLSIPRQNAEALERKGRASKIGHGPAIPLCVLADKIIDLF